MECERDKCIGAIADIMWTVTRYRGEEGAIQKAKSSIYWSACVPNLTLMKSGS